VRRFGKWHTDFSLQIQHNDLANFDKEWGRKLVNGKFYQMLCAGDFLHGAQTLVKLTQGVRVSNLSQAQEFGTR